MNPTPEQIAELIAPLPSIAGPLAAGAVCQWVHRVAGLQLATPEDQLREMDAYAAGFAKGTAMASQHLEEAAQYLDEAITRSLLQADRERAGAFRSLLILTDHLHRLLHVWRTSTRSAP